MLRELARSYLTVVKDRSRVMNRLKALYRSWAIPCAGRDVYYPRHRSQWLEKIPEAGTRRRAEQLYQQLDLLQHLRQQARRELLAESRKHAITAKLRQIPSLGPIRSALAVALIQTPHRFRSKRQLWTYSGLGLETRDSGEYHYVDGQVRRRKKQATIRDLNKDYSKMRSKWNHVRPAAGLEGRKPEPAARITNRGWKSRNLSLLPVEGEKCP